MSAIPCCHKIVCPDGADSNLDFDTPLANLTSELPDKDLFIGLNWGWDNNVPPLGSNFNRVSCLGLCTSAFSQQDADACAARAQLICDSGSWGPPPNSGPPPNHGPPLQPPPNSPQGLFTNQTQSCTAVCPDGSPFTWTIANGYIIASSVLQANEMAFSLACQFAAANMICLGALSSTHACVNSAFSATSTFTGGLAPFSTSIVSGSLPPGLSPADGADKKSFRVFGTPTQVGDYSFTVRATDSRGNFMQKAFTIHVLGISNATTMPHAMEGRAYSQQLNGTGGTAPFTYLLVSGSLGSNLVVSSSGLVTGTPDYVTKGAYTGQVKITDADANVCVQDVTITTDVAPGPNWDAFVWSFPNNVSGSGSGIGRQAQAQCSSNGVPPFGFVTQVTASGVTYTGPSVNVRVRVTLTYSGNAGQNGFAMNLKKAGIVKTAYGDSFPSATFPSAVTNFDFATGVGAGEAWTFDDAFPGNAFCSVHQIGNVASATILWEIFNL